MCAGTNNWRNRYPGFERHHHGALLEVLQPSIRATLSFRINQERLPGTHRFDGFLNAFNRGIALRAFYGNEMRQMERLSDNGVVEERLLQQDCDPPRYRADHCRRIC